jgi:endonuclease/exonuclease/phosphatase family metal-dependent hydrolase
MFIKKIFFCLFICVLGYSYTAQNESQIKDSITILSWNIQMLPHLYSPFTKYFRKKQKKRLPEIVNYLNENDFEIIVLQEVFDLRAVRELKKKLKAKYPYIQIPLKKGAGIQLSNGIMIASKTPLEYVDHVVFSKPKGNEKMAQKGCVLVKCNWGNQPLFISGTHLNSRTQEARRNQYKTISNHIIKPYISDSIPFFLVGDMNTSYNSRYFTEMMEVFQLHCSALKDKAPYTYSSRNSWNSINYNVWIDYIFHNQNKNVKIIDQYIIRPTMLIKDKKVDLADHYGIALKICLN